MWADEAVGGGRADKELRFENWDRGSRVAYDPSSGPLYTFKRQP